MREHISALRTEAVLGWFDQISAIPRCSGSEDRIAAWIAAWAEERGYRVQMDRYSNTVVRVPATPGKENAVPVILQSHLDMVCEKIPGSKHNFKKDPVKVIREGDWITAEETTLGADDGIGIAISLAAADSHWDGHPPLDLLFTAEEETGLTGAINLDGSFLTPGSRLINLDSEDEGRLTAGSAGGGETFLRRKGETVKKSVSSTGRLYRWRVSGLKSGHSGLRIGVPHGNAIKIIGRFLGMISDYRGFELHSVAAGKAHNVIPGEGIVSFLWHGEEADLFQAAARFEQVLLDEYRSIEPDIFTALTADDGAVRQIAVFSADDLRRMVQLIRLLPHGVSSYADKECSLVETSANTAMISAGDGQIELTVSYRSFLSSRIEEMRRITATAAEVTGFTADTGGTGYPPWKPVWNSPLLLHCARVYRELFGQELELEVVHAGLECGILENLVPGLDMVSIGPTVEGVHTTGERLSVSSLERTVAFLSAVLKEL